MTPEQIQVAVRNAYYLGWNSLTETQKESKYAATAQDAASRGEFAEAAALVLATALAVR